ncbi:hypothetical protein Val02_76840 [Virgisporangium aliadipatigenens]|uniref:Uncharacterized protein n=1 Tax=Virgisporangium aliadipatigenens TaxID=741659 RepID=A0A8J3YW54_9ACTN|nr:hypothetical protein [Virgisporangium aliadipatigenens]GIJ50798.1 hypothetical protein Val02_76840 [Virgisporangium aliadipatigenens]
MRRVLSSSEQDKIVELAAKGDLTQDIADRFGVTRQAIRNVLRRRGVPGRRVGKLTDEQRREVVDRFEAGEKPADIAAAFGLAEPSVRGLLDRRGVDPRVNHTLREDAFDDLSDPRACCWAGFVFTDGSVSRRHGHKGSVSIGLAIRDYGHLESFRNFLGSTHAISVSNQGRTCQFSVRSDHLVDRLLELGRYSDKISTRLFFSRDFWRGVVDGDGSIGAYRVGNAEALRPQFRLCGREALLTHFLDFLDVHGIVGLSVRPHKSIFNVGTNSGPAAEIIELLYVGAVVALPRKAEMAWRILNEATKDFVML